MEALETFVKQVLENATDNLPKDPRGQCIWECMEYVEDQLATYNQENEPIELGNRDIEYIADCVKKTENSRAFVTRGMRFTRDKKQTSKVFRARKNQFKQYATDIQTALLHALDYQ